MAQAAILCSLIYVSYQVIQKDNMSIIPADVTTYLYFKSNIHLQSSRWAACPERSAENTVTRHDLCWLCAHSQALQVALSHSRTMEPSHGSEAGHTSPTEAALFIITCESAAAAEAVACTLLMPCCDAPTVLYDYCDHNGASARQQQSGSAQLCTDE